MEKETERDVMVGGVEEEQKMRVESLEKNNGEGRLRQIDGENRWVV